jgi:hypothetical protein
VANGSSLSVIGSGVTAWRDAFAAFNRMPVLFAAAFAAVLALQALASSVIPKGPASASSGIGVQLLEFGVEIIQGVLLTPLAIAVHRYVLLGEIAGSYRIEPADQRFRRFVLFTVIIQLILGVPNWLMAATEPEPGAGPSSLLGVIVTFILFVGALIVTLRTLILFPAIAVDAPGATWANALRDTKGHSWLAFFIVLAVGIPALVVFLPIYFWLLWPAGPSFGGLIVFVVLQSVFTLLAIAAFAAMASRLYAAFGHRLG